VNVAPDPVFGIGLCAGGCGLELGLEIAIPGYRSICLVERETSVAGRMAARMQEGSLPFAPIWDDVSTFDGRRFRGFVSIISAGFPCQPFSVAGKRKGTGDERWIWPDIARIIGEVAPAIVFIENVPGLLLDPDSDPDPFGDLEQQSDDALGGMGAVLRDLAGLGFDAEWCCVRASDVGASHGRRRVFILAYQSSKRSKTGRSIRILRSELESSWNGFEHGVDKLGNTANREQSRLRERTDGCEIETRRSGVHVVNPECPERWPGAIGSGCDRTGFDREGETSSRAGNGEPVLADSASERLQERGDSSGILRSDQRLRNQASAWATPRAEDSRERAAAERTSAELDDSAGRGQDAREPSGGIGQPDGAILDVGNSVCGRRFDLGSDSTVAQGSDHGVSFLADNSVSIFAPGPSDPKWQDLLVQCPWLRPSVSQAEAESYFRNLVDGLALFWLLSAPERSGRLGMASYLCRQRWHLFCLLGGLD